MVEDDLVEDDQAGTGSELERARIAVPKGAGAVGSDSMYEYRRRRTVKTAKNVRQQPFSRVIACIGLQDFYKTEADAGPLSRISLLFHPTFCFPLPIHHVGKDLLG